LADEFEESSGTEAVSNSNLMQFSASIHAVDNGKEDEEVISSTLQTVKF
jgi:hypothetical protein